MAYQATVLRVMIASPGDVTKERFLVREILHQWNDIHSSSTGLVLLPVGWETHSSPELGDRPQQLINDRVLRGCDLLVGLFWTRLGTPTGVSESGTVEEIERHLKDGKPVMVYFSTEPVAQGSLDDDDFQQQMKSLREFKKWCQVKGLIETFDNLRDFEQKFNRHLQIALRDNPYLASFASRAPTLENDSGEASREVSLELSSEAKEMLIETSKDNHGVLLVARYIGGQSIQTNGRNFVVSSDRRSNALWEAALEELVNLGLLTERGYKGEIFEITHLGYKMADQLQK